MAAVASRGRQRPSSTRRRIVGGLRALLIAGAVIGLFVGWKLNQVLHQRSVVEEVAKFDAKIHYDYEYRGASTPPGPKWLRRIFGEDFFTTVAGVEIVADRVNGETVAAVATLPHLTTLFVNADGVDDQGLTRLAGATRLEQLTIRSADVTDAGLAQLTVLKALTSLVVDAPRITDVGLIPLEALPNLTKVELFSTRVTSAGVHRLRAALPQCDIRVFRDRKRL